MNVNKQIMFHYHKLGIYDELWNEGKEITVDSNFKSFYGRVLNEFNTAVKSESGDISFDKIINYYLRMPQELDRDMVIRLLKEARRIIRNMNVYNRERALEDYRKDNAPNLPSRLNSIWLADSKSFDFWGTQIIDEKEIYKVEVTGEIFKSSDRFIPDNHLSTLEMYEASKEYWFPSFTNEKEEETAEYLFHGNIKILQKI